MKACTCIVCIILLFDYRYWGCMTVPGDSMTYWLTSLWDSGDHACSTYTKIQYLTIESIYESHRDLYSRCKYSSCYWFIFILITKSQLISLQYLQHRKFRITKSSTHENQSVILLPWIISDGVDGREWEERGSREGAERGREGPISVTLQQTGAH